MTNITTIVKMMNSKLNPLFLLTEKLILLGVGFKPARAVRVPSEDDDMNRTH